MWNVYLMFCDNRMQYFEASGVKHVMMGDKLQPQF